MASSKEKGGYDVEFVNSEPKDVTCSICLFVLREPMQAEECGHRFCKSCVVDLRDKNGSGNITCPQDRTINKVFKDRGKEREIMDYLVKCTNVSSGCQWTGELRDLEKHIENCEYQLVTCVNERCNEEVQRRYLLQHVDTECTFRNVNCEYCKKEMKFHVIEEHNEVCQNKPIECKRCKNKEIPKELMDQHLQEECPLTVCEYSDIGCQETVKRGYMYFHKENSTEPHLDHVINKFREQEKSLESQLHDKENQLKRQQADLNRQSVTIQRQKEQLAEQQTTISGLQMQMKEIFGKYDTLQEQVNGNKEEMNEQVRRNNGRLDCLQQIEAFKNEVIWVIDNFTKKFEGVKRGNNMYSQIFFTQKGYKCKVELYLNGNSQGKRTHISIYIKVEEGPFDDALVWPMDAKISFCVLKNDLEKNKHSFSTTSSNESERYFQKPDPSTNMAYGAPHFIPHNSTWNFVVDNTLTLKISVE